MKSYLLLSCLLLSACVSLPSALRNTPVVDLSYQQVSRDVNNYKEVPVRWGGVIIDVVNEEHSSLIQAVFYPLDYEGRPQLYKPGEGRFVVASPEFLDPAVYAKDKEITVAGIIQGTIERTVGKRMIQVPLLSAKVIHLWPTYSNHYDYRSYGPYPYFGYPAYPGFYPFYPGGIYSPYYRRW